MKKRRQLNPLALVFALVVIFIPTIIAVILFNQGGAVEPTPKNATAVELSDLRGGVMKFGNKDKEGKEMLSLFSEMCDESEEIESLPEPLREAPFFKASFSVDGASRDYKFYFSTTGDSYIEDYNGKAYRIKSSLSSKFINTPYASSLYESSALPICTAEGKQLLPSSVVWNYRAASGSFVAVDSERVVLADAGQSYDGNGSFAYSFSVEPDHAVVKILGENSEELYNGTLAGLSDVKLDIKEDTTLKVELTAKWYEDKARDYQGEATYKSFVNVSAPASFVISDSSVIRGGVLTVTAYNVKDPTSLKFTSEPALTYAGENIDVKFASDGKNSYAIIPTDMNTEETAYKFTLSYGAVTTAFDVEVKTRTYRTYADTCTLSYASISTYRSEKALSDFKAVIDGLANKITLPVFDGKFSISLEGETVESASSKHLYRLGFGHPRYIEATGETYQNETVEYICIEGAGIVATEAGTVVYTGVLDYPGKFVVVDHGLGLMSVYMHLSEYSVAVGDVVKEGQLIGKAGDTGFVTDASTRHAIQYFVGNKTVCGYELEEIGLSVAK